MRSQKHSPATAERRPGAVLLIVITLMALFTAVGLSFVYYAESEATASKLFRESTDLSRPDVDPEPALAYGRLSARPRAYVPHPRADGSAADAIVPCRPDGGDRQLRRRLQRPVHLP